MSDANSELILEEGRTSSLRYFSCATDAVTP